MKLAQIGSMETITCILILDTDNDHVWVPYADYQTNPTVGTVVLKEKVTVPEPVVRESCEHWFIKAVKSPKHSEYHRTYGGKQAGKFVSSEEIYRQMMKEQDEQRRKRDDWMRERGK